MSESYVDATLLEVLPDGTFRLQTEGEERVVRLDGMAPKQPLPAEYLAIAQRFASSDRPWRLIMRAGDRSAPTRGQVQCFGWQDKSGDVWVDLRAVLVERGLADVAP